MKVREMCEAAELMAPSDWPVLIVTEDAWAHGEKLPPYIGPFHSPADANAWAEKHVEYGQWVITDLAMATTSQFRFD